MKGQKNCPICKKNCGPRTISCSCGYNYFNKEKIINEKRSGKRGKKKCPHCETLNNARVISCECGYNFSTKTLEQRKDYIPDPPMIDVNEEWKNLICGDVFEVIGGGDYYMADNYKINLTPTGSYEVLKMQGDGIVAYGQSGTCFIGMVDGHSKNFPSIVKEKHILKKRDKND